MVYWETADPHEPYLREFADMWRAADKVVYSRSRDSVSSRRTALEHDFHPDAVRQMKDSATRRLTIGGANLAGQALGAGLVDELRVLIHPVVIGGGKPWLPGDVHVPLRLLDTRPFASGVVYLRYAPTAVS